MNDPETFQGRTRAELNADADELNTWIGICIAVGVFGMIGYGLASLLGGWWRLLVAFGYTAVAFSALWVLVSFARGAWR